MEPNDDQITNKGINAQCPLSITVNIPKEGTILEPIRVTWTITNLLPISNVFNLSTLYLANDPISNGLYQVIHSNLHV